MQPPNPQLASAEVKSAVTAVRCSASDVLRWSGLADRTSAATDEVTFLMRRVKAGCSLLVEGQPFENLYLVASGSFKCVQTDSDGYEQVLAFAIHGDCIGLDGLGQDCVRTGASALEDSSVVTLPMRAWLELGRRLSIMETLLHHAVGMEVARRGDNQYLMAAPSSEVRMARFLLQFADRRRGLGHSQRRLHMFMSRRDIASFLGVAHETVSRVLMALVREGYIAVSHRDIELLDVPALTELQRTTRGRQAQERREAISHQTTGVAPTLQAQSLAMQF